MRWVLLELLPLFLGSAAFGLGVGYLLWRWRRRHLPASAWHDVTGRLRSAEAALDEARAEVDHLTDEVERLRLQHAAGADDSSSERVAGLSSDLETERERLREVSGEAERLRARNSQLQASLHEASVTLARIVVEEAETNQLKRRIRDLETELRALRAKRSRPETSPPEKPPTADRWTQAPSSEST